MSSVKHRICILIRLVAPVLLFIAAQAAANPPPRAESCANCHGAGGISQHSDVPIIAGPSDFFLENQLILFQGKERPCVASHFKKHQDRSPAPDHCALVADFSEAEIKALATYFSEQPYRALEQSIDQALAAKGEKIHERSCDRCHAKGGSLAMDDAGILAGQWLPYLIRTMEGYREGDRWQDEKMKAEMVKLSDEDIKALAHYYAGEGKK